MKNFLYVFSFLGITPKPCSCYQKLFFTLIVSFFFLHPYIVAADELQQIPWGTYSIKLETGQTNTSSAFDSSNKRISLMDRRTTAFQLNSKKVDGELSITRQDSQLSFLVGLPWNLSLMLGANYASVSHQSNIDYGADSTGDEAILSESLKKFYSDGKSSGNASNEIKLRWRPSFNRETSFLLQVGYIFGKGEMNFYDSESPALGDGVDYLTFDAQLAFYSQSSAYRALFTISNKNPQGGSSGKDFFGDDAQYSGQGMSSLKFENKWLGDFYSFAFGLKAQQLSYTQIGDYDFNDASNGLNLFINFGFNNFRTFIEEDTGAYYSSVLSLSIPLAGYQMHNENTVSLSLESTF